MATIVSVAALLFSLAGCTQILSLIEGTGLSSNNPSPGSPPPADSIRVVISELSANLVTGGLTPAQATVITQSAQANVTAAKVPETDFEKAMPVALAGAEYGLADQTVGLTETARIKAVGLITSSFMGSLNGRFAATSRSIENRRALSLNAQVLTNLLARLSKAAVANLVNTGIGPANLGKTAGEVVGNMITGLASGGVNKSLVSEALVQITQNAVGSLKDAGVGDSAMAVAVQSVTKGAVSAVATIKVEGVSTADFPAMTKQIAQGAAASLEAVISSTANMKTLVASVATGSTEGIALAVKTVALDPTRVSLGGSDILKAMVENATQGTTEGVMKNLSVNVSADASGLIGAVTGAASKQLEVSKADMQLTSTDIQSSVATGASSAAQTSLSGALTTNDLQSAIVFQDASGAATQLDPTALTTAISAGIAQAMNAPPEAVFQDLAVVVNNLATLDGSKSTDDKDTLAQLRFLWTLIQKPKNSGAQLNSSVLPQITFTPDVAGTYLVSLKVTDTKDAESVEVYGVVTATSDNTNVHYEGKTAEERLIAAKALAKTGDYPEARDELLIILGHYPDGPLFDETILRLAQVYDGLEQGDLAGPRFKEVITRTTPVTKNLSIGVQARLHWADKMTSKAIKDSATADAVTTTLQAVLDNRAGTTDEGEARRLKANLLSSTGKHAEAVIAYQSVLALPNTLLAPEGRYWASLNMGFSYSAQKLWSQAYTTLQNSHPPLAVSPESRWSLSLLKWADAMWPWWFSGEAQNDLASGYTQATTGIDSLVKGVADAGMDASDRMDIARTAVEFYLWGKGNNAASKQKAVDLAAGLLNGTTTVTNTTTNAKRVWLQLRLGQAYQNVKDSTLSDADRQVLVTKAIDAFAQAQGLGWGKWYGWNPAAEAMVEAAAMWHWNSNDSQKDTKAQALVTTVISSYPVSYGSYPKAFANYRQGEILRDIGNDLRDQVGKDFRTPLQNAIVSFSKVTSTNFPDLDKDTWFFINAPQNIGDCYTSLKEFAVAENYFKTSLKDPNLSPSSKVWVELSLANCYGEQVMQLLQEGNVDATDLDNAQAIWTKAVAAFAAVAEYKDGTKPLNRGEPAAHALLQEGRFLQNAANTVRWNLNMSAELWTPLYEQAVVAFQKLTPSAFPDLPSDGWEFNEATISAADCQFKLGIYDQGRLALKTLLQDMDQGTVPDQARWWALKQLASSYRDEAQNVGNGLNDTQRASTTIMNKRFDLYRAHLREVQALYDIWKVKGQGNTKADNHTAWALNDAAWSYLDMFDVRGWDHTQSTNGDNGYSPADWTEMQALHTELDTLKAQILGHSALSEVDGGQTVTRLYRVLGHWYENWANRLPGGTLWSERAGQLTKAMDYYDLVIGNPASTMDDYGAALKAEVSVKSQYARNATDLVVRKAAFLRALDLMDQIIVSPRVYINQVAWSCITVAQLYRDLHSSYYRDPNQLGGLGLPDMDGLGAWQTVVVSLMDPIVKHEANYGKLDDGGAMNEASRLLSDAQNAKLTVQVW